MAPRDEGPTADDLALAQREYRRRDAYAQDFKRLDEEFRDEVSKGKPVLDYVAMLGVIALTLSLLILTLHDYYRVGYNEKAGTIIIFCIVIVCVLGYRAGRATSAQVERILLSGLDHFAIWHPRDWGSGTLKGLWRSLVLFCVFLAGAALVLVGTGLSRTARRIGETAMKTAPVTPPPNKEPQSAPIPLP